MASEMTFVNKSGRVWQFTTAALLIVCVGLLIALIVVATDKDDDNDGKITRVVDDSYAGHTCGQHGPNPNGHVIDLSEPTSPGPFHDLTSTELIKLRKFLENDATIQAHKMDFGINFASSYIYAADLWLPPKAEVLDFLDNGGQQPPRQARVMMFRGDKNPAVIEEWICGPLPDITKCDLLNLPGRRNPVQFSLRPFSGYEFYYITVGLFPLVEASLETLLVESYNATFSDPTNRLTFNPVPMGSALSGNIDERLMWMWFIYDVPYPLLHPTDMGVLLNLGSSNVSEWSLEKVWYAGAVFDSLDELAQKYEANTITKSRLSAPVYSHDLYSTLHQRGDPMPPNPQRPPTLVEPDGRRYSVVERKVDYMGWSFNFRMSSFAGPALYDVKFKGDRIAYEMALSEIAAYYSGNSPLSEGTDYVDSGALSGLGSKALVPGGDCPDTATLINFYLMNQFMEQPGVYDAVFCIFEQNNGYPLRRHLQYARPTGYYGGMLDSALTLRSALTVGNYDYIIDFIFHQNGAIEIRLMSTGYIQSNIFRAVEQQYGWKIQERILGNLHHHMFHIKADLDIHGTSNRYETLDIKPQKTVLTWDPNVTYHQTMFETTLKRTEQDSLYQYDINTPKDHIIHNSNVTNKWGERKAFRIHLSGMSKNLFTQGEGNEPCISWSRQQIAVTKHKESEFRSSSNYGMFDSANPVVDFSNFYADDESIVDEDLVFWLTLGLHHIPHTEDLPVTPTAGNHLTAWLLPYNYFLECPSMASRDAIFVGYKDPNDIAKGVNVERNGNSMNICSIPKPTLEDDVAKNPDRVIESRRMSPAL